jgi:hypothetical protein
MLFYFSLTLHRFFLFPFNSAECVCQFPNAKFCAWPEKKIPLSLSLYYTFFIHSFQIFNCPYHEPMNEWMNEWNANTYTHTHTQIYPIAKWQNVSNLPLALCKMYLLQRNAFSALKPVKRIIVHNNSSFCARCYVCVCVCLCVIW